ncbi:RHS repeat-associated core domain-containing protein [Aquimarina aquimarini]|uniref:RHS repeat-associated core domain-containing protein n=1 Tax=Aquimarina aquimarini TaxID=1191734 RepID=UPI00131F2FE0|nr:RHS repeat-associated core domain-containing protein [Aquimarina aquimarini]
MKKIIIFLFLLNSSSQLLAQNEGDPLHCMPQDQIWVERFYDIDDDDVGGAPLNQYICPGDPYPGVANGGDCNDRDPNIVSPVRWYKDGDNDTYGSRTVFVTDCTRPTGYTRDNRDCDDTDAAITIERRWYKDSDGDGKGERGEPIIDCSKPAGSYVLDSNDCDDTDPNNWLNTTWYVDSDEDGIGEGEPIISSEFFCMPPNDGKKYAKENGDKCPGVYGLDNGCPVPPPPNHTVEEPKNTIRITGYDVTGKIIAENKSYYDDLGKPVQVQYKDVKTGKTWASETLYDSQGRPALQTLEAPTNEDIPLDFFYRPGFIKKNNNTVFSTTDFENDPENPSTVGTQPNTVGWYYSTQNTSEPYQDVTGRPYSRTIYSELNPGSVLKTIGGNKIQGQWKNGYVFSMPAGQELSKPDAFGEAKYDQYKVIKTISRDVHGVENVVFTDTDGNTLAAARSGNASSRKTVITIGEQGYVDIHVPKGTTGVQMINVAGRAYDIYNLMTENKVNTAPGGLSNGFYRIAIRNLNIYNVASPVKVECKENYYDYSLNYYDKSGKLIKSEQPLADSAGNKLESTFEYDALGQLTQTHSPDEGDAWFLYRRDGQIRFSINSKQWENKEFSYTNYDDRGRPVESGVYKDASLTYLNVFVSSNITSATDPFMVSLKNVVDDKNHELPFANRSEQHLTTYDHNDNIGLAVAFGSDTRKSNYAQQSFSAGNVAKTKTANPETTTTWYSYDIYGRVQWIVQQVNGLTGAKTIDYVYDPVTSQVNKVYYQKGASDQFIHQYMYDPANYSLTKVETSVDDINYTENALYKYYETGGLKRTIIAEGLQGVDYVYNLQGALKSINHPSLTGTNDPGGDTGDLFGMIIDYHDHDYNRPLRNIKSANYGINQYNGNIKGIRWNSDYNPVQGKEHTYNYTYNRNNWLQGAEYGHFTGDYTSLPTISEGEEGTAAQDHVTTTDVINSGSKEYIANKSITLQAGFHAKARSNVSAKISGSGVVHDVNAGTLAANANDDYKVDNITYDTNGNILSLNRNKHTENGGGNAMDRLSYKYDTTNNKPNQLKQVIDTAGDVAGADDIGTQTDPDNYVYNTIGQLVTNRSENITYLYNASGLVTEVQKSNQPLVKFFYNDKGHRVRKESYNPTTRVLTYTEHYVRDAAGTAMAIYRDGQVIENTIYGASRLGVRKSDGTHLYQLTDHLGNVRAVVGRNAQGQAMAMTSATDYYPFGMPMPGRNQVGDYRYAYQGQEKDPETGKEAFELRLWDARIGRWLTTDPYGQHSSPYLGMGNDPVNKFDPDGGVDRYKLGKDGSITYYDDKGGDSVDYLFTEGDLSNEIRVTDTSILPQLEMDRNWDLSYNGIHEGNYAITDNFSEAFKVFEFASLNTNDEWVLRKFTNGTFLGTNNYSDAARGDTPNFSDLNLVLDIHSHPGNSPKDGYASGYSFEQIRKRAKNGYGSHNFGDMGRAGNIYNKMINAGKISVKNRYKGAPKFQIYRPHLSTPKYFSYDAWRKRF